MSIMPAYITKRPILERLDDLSLDKASFNLFYTDLKNSNPANPDLIDLGKTHLGLSTAEENHLAAHWFGDWWTGHQPTNQVIRNGLIQACELAIDRSMPLDCYWVCAANDFQVISCLSSQQVTVLFLTPPPPPPSTPVPMPHSENIWVVKRTGPGPAGVVTDQLKTNRNVP